MCDKQIMTGASCGFAQDRLSSAFIETMMYLLRLLLGGRVEAARVRWRERELLRIKE